MENQNIIKLPRGIYKGYVWMSDSNKPQSYIDVETEFEFRSMTVPFVVEAMLMDRDGNNYMLKTINEKVYCKSYKKVDVCNGSKPKTFVANNIEGVKRIKMVQTWKPGKQLLGKFETQEPGELLLVDFE